MLRTPDPVPAAALREAAGAGRAYTEKLSQNYVGVPCTGQSDAPASALGAMHDPPPHS